MSFAGKVVVITGASSGIGEALALLLADRGASLVLAARRLEALERVAEACRERGARAVVLAADVSLPDDCERIMDAAVQAFDGIDFLVNNAGISMWARFDEVQDLSIFERLMRVNYLGAVYCTHFALPYLKARGGMIVGISSLTGKTGVPTRSGYGATKHALQGFLDSLRIELRNEGVDVLVVSPGFVATEIRSKALSGSGVPLAESPRDEARGTMSLKRCVDLIVRGMASRKREIIMTPRAKFGMWLKILVPGLVDRMAADAVGDPGRRQT
jgi:short-subunit dehydrogenase